MVSNFNLKQKAYPQMIIRCLFLLLCGFLLFGCSQTENQEYNSRDEIVGIASGTWECPQTENASWIMEIDENTITSYTLFSDGTTKFETTYDISWNEKAGTFSYTYKSNGSERTIEYYVDKSGPSIVRIGKNEFVYKKVDNVDAE